MAASLKMTNNHDIETYSKLGEGINFYLNESFHYLNEALIYEYASIIFSADIDKIEPTDSDRKLIENLNLPEHPVELLQTQNIEALSDETASKMADSWKMAQKMARFGQHSFGHKHEINSIEILGHLNNFGFFIETLVNRHLLFLNQLNEIDDLSYSRISTARIIDRLIEMSRLNVNFENLKSILIDIEDKSFYINKGVSIKAIIRGSISQVKVLRKAFRLLESGGSTITMQLARTLFIPSNQNKYLRKLFEIWIALWLQRKFTKQEILNLYIVSVRYDYGVMGLSKAIKHFYGNLKRKTLTPEESFVLVERLSNITGTHRQERIDYLIAKSTVKLDNNKINNIYQTLKAQGKIKK